MKCKNVNCENELPESQVEEYYQSQGNTSLTCAECLNELNELVKNSMTKDGSSNFDPEF